MKNKIREYLGLFDDEKQSLLEEAIVVFDTNVFLNLYRYSNPTRKALFEIMKSFEDRLWMPYQVAKEFMRNRPDIILENVKKYDNMIDKSNKLLQDFASCLRVKTDDKSCMELKDIIVDWIETKRKSDLEVTNCNDDTILLRILEIFDGKVGSGFDEIKLKEIKKEGKQRYELKIPPGYKDSKKASDDNDNNAFGDLIYWKEILEYSKEKNVDIVLVTSDQKEDWWTIVKGKTIGPRPELLREFYDFTSRRVYLYEMNNFIDIVKSTSKIKFDESVVDEVEMVNSSQFQNDIPAEIALIGMGIDLSLFHSLSSQISRHREKNVRRRAQIINLQKKFRNGNFTAQDKIAYVRNKENILRSEAEIKKIEDQLAILNNSL